MARSSTNDRSHHGDFLPNRSERLVACYWLSAFTLATMGLTVFFCSLQTASSDVYIGYLLGPLMLLTAAALYGLRLHRR